MARQTVASAWDDYMLHGRSMGLAPATLTSREGCAKKFLTMYGDKNIENITTQHVSRFFLAASTTRSASSMTITHATMSGFFNYCVNTGKIRVGRNPMYGRRPPKAPKRERLRIPVNRFPELLTLAGNQSPRDRMVVALGLYTLLRDQEMALLRVRDVELDAGYIRATIYKSQTEDRVAISHDLDSELRRYYLWYQDRLGAPLKPDMFLLPVGARKRERDPETGRFGAGLEGELDPYKSIRKTARIVTPLIEKMGYPVVGDDGRSSREGAHTLRRSGARAFYDYFIQSGRADALRIVQTMLHHEKMEMTQHYIGLQQDRQTRDQLVRGVSIFGFDQIATIGGRTNGESDNHGYEADHRASV